MENNKLVNLDALDKIAKELRKKALADISQQEEEIAKLRDEMIILEEDDLTMDGIIDNTFPSLTTEDKTLLGAINEINSKTNDGISKEEMNEILMEVFGITLDEEGE